jgi:hypothetical protein
MPSTTALYSATELLTDPAMFLLYTATQYMNNQEPSIIY